MRRNKEKSMILLVVLLMVSTNNLVIPVYSSISDNNIGNEKNFYTPNDPRVPTTPSSGVHSNPGHHSQSNCLTPPSQGGSGSGGSGGSFPSPTPIITPTPPSQGGSGGYYPSPTPTPPSQGGSGGYNPTPTPTTPITPPTKGGSGRSHHHHTPRHTPTDPPSGGSGGCACPSPPPTSGGSGGYYPPTPRTPTPVIVTPPSPLVPTTPPRSGGSGGSYYPPSTPLVPTTPPRSGGGSGGSYYPPTTPSSPLVPSPPVTPFVPSPPYIPDPGTTPPMPFDPTTPPFPCTYWGSHPGLIFGLLGWWAKAGGIFGVATLPGLNSETSLQEMLKNPRNDGYGSLYREGTASFLNSMASKNFAFSTKQVKDSFLASLASDKAAAAQAKLFKLANEKKLKPTTSKP